MIDKTRNSGEPRSSRSNGKTGFVSVMIGMITSSKLRRGATCRITPVLVMAFAIVSAGPGAIAADKVDVKDRGGETASGWKKEWVVEDGFSLGIDTQGYHYPTALAFVPEPGDGPKDPLYFVTELRGKIKVVTNDRTVYTFAEGFLHTEFDAEAPSGEAEFGLAGICLEPDRGYVFVTFAYQDGEALRNNIIRFETTPRTFALKPRAQTAFTEVFAPYDSGPSHQIGGCNVSDGKLYVGVGDGWNSPAGSRQLDTFQGKLIRMTLDGRPVADNPFYADDNSGRAANFVWAYGLRNPFSLEVANGKLVVADNGLGADRFMEVEPGKNYLWNGSDSSITANADYVFLDSVGPVQMEYFRPTTPAFPDRFRDQFYLAASGEPAGIIRVPYNVEAGRMQAVPQHLVGNTQGVHRSVTGVAFGPDGLYFTPLMPVMNGQGAVLKIRYEPEDTHRVTFKDLESFQLSSANEDRIIELMATKGCFGCHQVRDLQWYGATKGPKLGDSAMIERIQRRVGSPAYLRSLRELGARNEAPFSRYEEARDEVISARGRERVRTWIKYQILEPRFDGALSGMPDLGLSEVEAEAITRFLMGETSEGFIGELVNKALGNEQRRLIVAGAGGLSLGLSLWLVWWLVWIGRRRRRH